MNGKDMIHFFMLSCKKATELIEKKSMVALYVREKIQLNLHKCICDACTLYEKQSKQIDELLKKRIASDTGVEKMPLKNDELKERILKKLP